jgi:hypothetical protein
VVDLEANPVVIDGIPAADPLLEDGLVIAEAAAIETGQFVVSVDKGGVSRTLHKTGRCWRVPGVHYLRFITLDEDEEKQGMYSKVCRDCFPRESADASSNSDSSSSDSSSSRS